MIVYYLHIIKQSSKTKSKKKDKASFKDNNLEKEIQTESNNILPTPPPLKTKVVVDPDAVVSLSSSLKFASVKVSHSSKNLQILKSFPIVSSDLNLVVSLRTGKRDVSIRKG